jgi:predicted amidohydrolase YtcJ
LWGGFTEHQFVEERLPTIDELSALAPHTSVFLLHLYDRAILNAAAVRAVGYTKDSPNHRAAKSCATPKAIRRDCCWPRRTPPFCMQRWPRVRSGSRQQL